MTNPLWTFCPSCRVSLGEPCHGTFVCEDRFKEYLKEKSTSVGEFDDMPKFEKRDWRKEIKELQETVEGLKGAYKCICAVNEDLLLRNSNLYKVLKDLVYDVDECLEKLDPCDEEDCSDFHDLSLDSLPAAKKALEEEDS